MSILKCAPMRGARAGVLAIGRSGRDLERLVETEVLRDVAEVVADLDHRGDEVGRPLQHAIVEVARHERNRALEQRLRGAVRQLVDDLVEHPVRRIVGAVGRVDDVVDDHADRARHVRRDVELALHRVLAARVERRRRGAAAASVVIAAAAVVATAAVSTGARLVSSTTRGSDAEGEDRSEAKVLEHRGHWKSPGRRWMSTPSAAQMPAGTRPRSA